MKKKYLFYIVLILLILNGLLIYKLKHKAPPSTISEDSLKEVETMYENKFIVEKENDNLKLDENIQLINVKGDTLLAKDVFKNKQVVLRYSVLNCGDCIDAETAILASMKDRISGEIVIITYFEKIRGLIFDYKKLEKLGLKDIPIYLLVDNKLGIPLEKQNLPYYFNIDSNLNMSNFFIPIKEKPRLSNSYLNFSFKNYLKKK